MKKTKAIKDQLALEKHILAKAELTSRLDDAAIKGDLDTVRTLINQSAQGLKGFVQEGIPALQYAARYGKTEIVKALMTAEVDVNGCWDDSLRTALHHAAIEGHSEVITLLASSKNIQIDQPNAKGLTALMVAAGAHKYKAMETLLNSKANVNYRAEDGNTPLWFACEYPDTHTIQQLLNAKADAEVRDTRQYTPLMFASFSNKLPMVKSLHEAKANVNASSRDDGCTPLLAAAQGGAVEAADYLIQSKANLEAMDIRSKSTPLFVAIQAGQTKMVEFLLDQKANSLHEIGMGMDPLMEAALRGNLTIAKRLREMGLPLKRKANAGFNPLIAAIIPESPSEEMVKWLLDQGADPLEMDADGHHAIDYAVQSNQVKILEILLESLEKNGSTLDTLQEVVFNVLINSLKKGQEPILKFLARKKPYSMMLEANIDKAFHMALNLGYHKGVELLLKQGSLVNPNFCKGKPVECVMGERRFLLESATPLFISASIGDLESTKALMAAGAYIDAINIGIAKDGAVMFYTPLMMAYSSQEETALYLLARTVILHFKAAPKLKSYMTTNLSEIKSITEMVNQVCQTLLDMDPNIDFLNCLWISVNKFKFASIIPQQYRGHGEFMLSPEGIAKLVEKLYFKLEKGQKLDQKELQKALRDLIRSELHKNSEQVKQQDKLAEEIDAILKENANELSVPAPSLPYITYIEKFEQGLADCHGLITEIETFISQAQGKEEFEEASINQAKKRNQSLKQELLILKEQVDTLKNSLSLEHSHFVESRRRVALNIRLLLNQGKHTEALELFEDLKTNDKHSQWTVYQHLLTGQLSEKLDQIHGYKNVLTEIRAKQEKKLAATLKVQQKKLQLQEQQSLQAKNKAIQQEAQLTLELTLKEAAENAKQERKAASERYLLEKKKFSELQAKAIEFRIENAKKQMQMIAPSSALSKNLMEILKQNFDKELCLMEEVLKHSRQAGLELSPILVIGKIIAERNALLGLSARLMEMIKDLQPDSAYFTSAWAVKYRDVIFHAMDLCPEVNVSLFESNANPSLRDAELKTQRDFHQQTIEMTSMLLDYLKSMQKNPIQHLQKDRDVKSIHETLISNALFKKIQACMIEEMPSLERCKHYRTRLQKEETLYYQKLNPSTLLHAHGYSQGCLGSNAALIRNLYYQEAFSLNAQEFRQSIKLGKRYRHVVLMDQNQENSKPNLYFRYTASLPQKQPGYFANRTLTQQR